VFGQEAAQGQIFEQLKSLLGEATGKAMQDMVQSANAKPATGVATMLIGLGHCFLAHRAFSGTQCNLERATEAGTRNSRHSPGSNSLIWLYFGRRLPAPSFPSPNRSHRSRGRVVRRYVSWNGETRKSHSTLKSQMQKNLLCRGEDILSVVNRSS
jgi:hypothetical protein